MMRSTLTLFQPQFMSCHVWIECRKLPQKNGHLFDFHVGYHFICVLHDHAQSSIVNYIYTRVCGLSFLCF
jgi:hypothetical protein